MKYIHAKRYGRACYVHVSITRTCSWKCNDVLLESSSSDVRFVKGKRSKVVVKAKTIACVHKRKGTIPVWWQRGGRRRGGRRRWSRWPWRPGRARTWARGPAPRSWARTPAPSPAAPWTTLQRHAMQTKTTSSESCQSVTSHYTSLGKKLKTLFPFFYSYIYVTASMRQIEFMPFVCSVPVYLGDYYIPCIMAAIIE